MIVKHNRNCDHGNSKKKNSGQETKCAHRQGRKNNKIKWARGPSG